MKRRLLLCAFALLLSGNAHAAAMCEFLKALQPHRTDFSSLRGESVAPNKWKSNVSIDDFPCSLSANNSTLFLNCAHAPLPLDAKAQAIAVFESTVSSAEKCAAKWIKSRSDLDKYESKNVSLIAPEVPSGVLIELQKGIDTTDEKTPWTWQVTVSFVETQ